MCWACGRLRTSRAARRATGTTPSGSRTRAFENHPSPLHAARRLSPPWFIIIVIIIIIIAFRPRRSTMKSRPLRARARRAHAFFPSVGIDIAERSELPAALSLSFQLDVTVLVCV